MLNTLSEIVSSESYAILFDPKNYTLAKYFYSPSAISLFGDIVLMFLGLGVSLVGLILLTYIFIPDLRTKSNKSTHDILSNILSAIAILLFSGFLVGSFYYNLSLKPAEKPASLENLSPLFVSAVSGPDQSLKNDLRALLISRDCLELYSLLGANCHPTYVKFLIDNKFESDSDKSKLANPSNYLNVYSSGILAGTYDFSESVKAVKKIDPFKAISLEELVVEKLTKANSVEHTNVELIKGLQSSAGNLVDDCKSISGLNCMLFKKYFTKEVKKLNISNYYLSEGAETNVIDKNFKLAVLDLHHQMAEQEMSPSAKKLYNQSSGIKN